MFPDSHVVGEYRGNPSAFSGDAVFSGDVCVLNSLDAGLLLLCLFFSMCFLFFKKVTFQLSCIYFKIPEGADFYLSLPRDFKRLDKTSCLYLETSRKIGHHGDDFFLSKY